MELNQFCAPTLPLSERGRRGAVLAFTAPDFLDAAVVFGRATARALLGWFSVWVDPQELADFGSARVVVADDFNLLQGRGEDFFNVLRLSRDGASRSFLLAAIELIPLTWVVPQAEALCASIPTMIWVGISFPGPGNEI